MEMATMRKRKQEKKKKHLIIERERKTNYSLGSNNRDVSNTNSDGQTDSDNCFRQDKEFGQVNSVPKEYYVNRNNSDEDEFKEKE